MAARDRIRLIDLLRRRPAPRGVSMRRAKPGGHPRVSWKPTVRDGTARVSASLPAARRAFAILVRALRRILTALLGAGVIAGGWSATAAAAALAPLDPSAPAVTRPTTAPLRDRVLRTGPPARARSAASAERAYRAADGTTVNVQVSDSFAATPGNQAAVQTYVDFLGSRLHGAELSRLHVFIGSPPEVSAACGGGADVLACYFESQQRMYVPSQDPSVGRSPFTREYVVTHELGHHIARSRRNDPFPALDFGPKYWSSYKHICDGWLAGRYFPGNQGSHYVDDPGEGFADSYAHLHYPTAPWQYNPALFPDAGAFEAIRRDVVAPWNGPRVRRVRRSLSASHRVTTIPVTYSLDGTVALKLSGPRSANFDLEVRIGRRVVARSRARGSQDRLTGTVCRLATEAVGAVSVRVRRRSGAGRFTLRVSTPG